MNTMSIMDFEYAKITEKQSANISKKHSYPSNWREYMCLVNCSVISESLQLHGLQPARLLCPWGFSRQEYWRGLPFPPPGDLPTPGIKPTSSAPLLPPQPPVNSNNRRIVIIKNYHLLSVNQIPRIVLWQILLANSDR